MIKVLGILGIAGISIIYLFVVCASIVRGWMSEGEYKNEIKHK